MYSWKLRLTLLLFLSFVNFIYSGVIADIDLLPANYFIAAIFETIIVLVLADFGSSRVVVDLQIISTVLAFVHCYGFIIYMCYQEPYSYDHMQIVPNVALFARLLWIRKHDNDNYLGDGHHWLTWLRNSYFNLLGSHRKESYK